MAKYKLTIPPDEFNSEQFLEKTIKLKEANELGILAAKNQSQSKIDLAKSNL